MERAVAVLHLSQVAVAVPPHCSIMETPQVVQGSLESSSVQIASQVASGIPGKLTPCFQLVDTDFACHMKTRLQKHIEANKDGLPTNVAFLSRDLKEGKPSAEA